MEIADASVGIVIVILGACLVIGGIGLAIVISVERRWWEGMLTGMLSMPLPDFGLGSMMPMIQEVIKGIMEKVMTYVRLIALFGGASLSAVGIILIILGLYIWF